MLSFLAPVLLLVATGRGGKGGKGKSPKVETVRINGTIYADNWFEFYFNGELIKADPYDYVPHQAVEVAFDAPKKGRYSFAIHAKDFSDNITGLEYDNQCVGDGGLRALFSDGTFTDKRWTCDTYYYGPENVDGVPGCISDFNASYHFTPALCKVSGVYHDSCRSTLTPMTKGWEANYCKACRKWDNAVEWSEDEVGWGVPETEGDGYPWGTPDCMNPQLVDWGSSKFIWQPDLQFDNRIVCRFSYDA